MQLPAMKTPYATCIACSLYTEAMGGKFPSNASLAASLTPLAAARSSLETRHAACGKAELALIAARVELKFCDKLADDAVRTTQRQAELADGAKNGRIATAIFPDGTTPVTKAFGETEAKELRALEGRLEATSAIWPDALKRKTAVFALRQRYEAALAARAAAYAALGDKRALRDAAKEDLVEAFAVIAGRVRSEFPRDRTMQDLFFDDVRSSRNASDDAGEETAVADSAS